MVRAFLTPTLTACLALGATACAPGRVDLRDPSLNARDAETCEQFVAALPDTMAGELRRSIHPEDAPGAAYGDPPITIECGATMPSGFDRFSSCDEVDGVGWYIPPEQIIDPQKQEMPAATLGTVGWRPVVAVRVPPEYRPEGLAATLSELAEPVRRTLEQESPCV